MARRAHHIRRPWLAQWGPGFPLLSVLDCVLPSRLLGSRLLLNQDLAETKGMQERREEPRAEVEVEVRYRTAQEFLSAYARNISGGGIFVRTAQPLPLNQGVRLRFTLPGVSHQFDVSGIVVWSSPCSSRTSLPSGMGIKLVDLDPQSRDLIAEFLKVKSPAPAAEK
jgi:uncharacterized protein (TIGR02266 family)